MNADRALLDLAPPGTLVPVEWVRELLVATAVDDTEHLVDLSVAEVAVALDRAPSTIRAWLHAGALEGYKLRGREWRVRREDLRAYQDAQRERSLDNRKSKSSRAGREVDLSSWRKLRREAAT